MDTSENRIYIGVDIGGSHITAGEVVLQEWEVKPESRKRRRVDSHGSSEAILEAWASVLGSFVVDSPHKEDVYIGVAMPGPFDYQNGISYIKELNKYDSLYGVNVKQELARRLSINESNILLRNDAEAFLHGEVLYQNIPHEAKVIGVTLGTGLGSAVSWNGQTRDVFKAITPMKGGIAEDYISSRWFAKRYKDLCGEDLVSVESLVNNDDVELKKTVFDEFGANLGVFIADFLEEEEASFVIMGGNIAKCFNLFEKALRAHIPDKSVLISQSSLWEDAALVGAASLWSGGHSTSRVV